MQVRSRATTGRELKPFETGEICVIGPAVFAGYYDNPEANAKAFRDGWFRTGDLGHIDDEGFVYITGRASDMYISGGSNIYPREIEEKILTHPGLAKSRSSACRTRSGARSASRFACAREGAAEVSELELATFLLAKVPRYKMPKRFFFWDALPKSGYGKMSEAAGPRRAGGAGPARWRREADPLMRTIQQPGPPAPERIQWVEARGRAFSFTLEAGVPLLEAARAALPRRDFAGGVAEHAGRGARPVRLCHAGAVEDAAPTPRSTATPSGPRA